MQWRLGGIIDVTIGVQVNGRSVVIVWRSPQNTLHTTITILVERGTRVGETAVQGIVVGSKQLAPNAGMNEVAGRSSDTR